jgi:hypothetical protein
MLDGPVRLVAAIRMPRPIRAVGSVGPASPVRTPMSVSALLFVGWLFDKSPRFHPFGSPHCFDY